MDWPETFGDILFQSTLSVRRATKILSEIDINNKISIHALRKESDARRASVSVLAT